ncbi:MAG: hypothetical protein MUC72_05405 [Acidobacteria bacterium]|jgi:hypothetical protein|nr:hypothetical protein [Acidobacteriota bacterium]
MKKFILAIALISLSMVPALQAQGKTITGVDPDGGKIKVWGFVRYNMNNQWFRNDLSVQVWLSYRGEPLNGAVVRIGDNILPDRGRGCYSKLLIDVKYRVGDRLDFSLEFPEASARLGSAPPFTGRRKMAAYTIENTIQWLLPAASQVIDLPAYARTGIPFRWNHTGTPATGALSIEEEGIRVYTKSVTGEELVVPVGALQPGKAYASCLKDEKHYFRVDGLFSPRSEIEFIVSCVSLFSTAPAK